MKILTYFWLLRLLYGSLDAGTVYPDWAEPDPDHQALDPRVDLGLI